MLMKNSSQESATPILLLLLPYAEKDLVSKSQTKGFFVSPAAT